MKKYLMFLYRFFVLQGFLIAILAYEIDIAIKSNSESIKIFAAISLALVIVLLVKLSILAFEILFLDIKIEKLNKQIKKLKND